VEFIAKIAAGKGYKPAEKPEGALTSRLKSRKSERPDPFADIQDPTTEDPTTEDPTTEDPTTEDPAATGDTEDLGYSIGDVKGPSKGSGLSMKDRIAARKARGAGMEPKAETFSEMIDRYRQMLREDTQMDGSKYKSIRDKLLS